MSKKPVIPEPSRGSKDDAEQHDATILSWEQWNRFGGMVRTSGREALALVALLAPNVGVKSLSIYTVSPQTNRAGSLLYQVNHTALRAFRNPEAAV